MGGSSWHGFGRAHVALDGERLSRLSARPETRASEFPVLRNEKGGVVRRPFSVLQAWLIAVSPQPGVAVAIGTEPGLLEHLNG